MSNTNVALFPNPTNNSAKVILDQNHTFEILTVTDLTGKQIETITLTPAQNNIDIHLGGLSNGLYIVTLNGEATQVVKKLIKQ